MAIVIPSQTLTCFHCGDQCESTIIPFEDHTFCCVGCKNVYELLSQNNLCDYYSIDSNPGVSQKFPSTATKFAYLDEAAVQRKLILYKDDTKSKVEFFIPTMHCSSCIWLLENLYKLDPSVSQSRVNFPKKTLSLTFDHTLGSLRSLVSLLSSIGYEPAIHLNDIEDAVKKEENKKLLYQIGVAGFAFGNIMLISFPEYFGLDKFTKAEFSKLFGYLNFILSVPVFLFSAQDYFKSAWQGLKRNFVGIDVPLALGIFVLFFRSAYEVFSHTGIGYFDTHSGLVFFLLIGKWFQQKTFDTLSFERDYKSYFPVASTVIKDGKETTVPVNRLNVGDRILIRNGELIPADSILLKGDGYIDFSFVTGESVPVKKISGEQIYAGGKQQGQTIELEVLKKVSQSYLTQLWNNEHFSKSHSSRLQTFQQKVSRYFTYALLFIAFGAAGWWLVFDSSLAMNAFTSVLIIACPCALALSSPFALGTAMRILGKTGFYVKAPEVVEHIAKTNHIVFDKTGTITEASQSTLEYVGRTLTQQEVNVLHAATNNSVHPLSKKIAQQLLPTQKITFDSFEEVTGKGIEATVDNMRIKIGSAVFAGCESKTSNHLATRVYINMNGGLSGYYELKHQYRKGLRSVIASLKPTHTLSLLSGDNESEQSALQNFFGDESQLSFNQTPLDKLKQIEKWRSSSTVMMLGDGLNDAGALKAADVGVSITENTAHFSPASDVIMDAKLFDKIPRYLTFCKGTLTVIHLSFVISLLYNIVGLSFAVQGTLSPVIAAILMPLSSVTVILFTTLATSFFAKRNHIL